MIDNVDDRPRYSLRQLLTLTTVLAFYFAVLGWAIRNCRPTRSGDVASNLSLVAIIWTIISLIQWRIRTVKLRSAGKQFGWLNLVAPFYTEARSFLVVLPSLAIIALMDLDRQHLAEMLVFWLPFLAIAIVGNYAFARIAVATEQGLISEHRSTPWDKISFVDDDYGLTITPDARKPSWWHTPYQYAVPEELRPVVRRLVAEANVDERESQLPAKSAAASQVGSAGASPSQPA